MPVTINGSSGITANDGSVFTNASGNVGVGTGTPTSGVKMDVVSADTSQQYVNVLKVKTTNTGDYHPAILFENNRNSVSNAVRLGMDSSSGAGSSVFLIQAKDGSGNFNTRLVVSNDGNLQFNSGYGSNAVAYGCRAWVNFDGTGTPAIRASGNVSSITDNGVGNYWVNFATAMPDTNYCVQGGRNWRGILNSDAWETGRVYVLTADTSNNTPSDSVRNFVTIYR